jgi:cyclohexyl-isocyanide hydratase
MELPRTRVGRARSEYGAGVEVGLLLFPDVTQLDLTAPFEVFSRVPGGRVHIVAKSLEPVRSDRGLVLQPTVDFERCPRLDVVMVPGWGQQALMVDDETLDFVRTQSTHATWTTSVCTGSLVLGAAGLLRGYRATTHWAYLDALAVLGAIAVDERVVVDRDRITGGGVTAGIDAALTVVAEAVDRRTAGHIQLHMQYAPEPPFHSGHPATADAEVVASVRNQLEPLRAQRLDVARAAAARMRA